MGDIVDLRTLENGDTVHFRGTFKTEVYCKVENNDGTIGLGLGNCPYFTGYHTDGSLNGSEDFVSPFDIIRIEKAPFDWSTAKQGMAFNHNSNGTLFYFVAHDFSNEVYAVMTEDSSCAYFRGYKKKNLTRAPEHDLDIVKGGE
jgi:hypothetical protein